MNGPDWRFMLTITMFLTLVVLSSGISPALVRQAKDLNWTSPTAASTLGEGNSVENTIGVVTLNGKNYTRMRKLLFYNGDGSLWYDFSFYEEDADPRFQQAKVEFRPFSFHRDYFVLALKCVGKDSDRFEVVVNETTGLTKFIKRHGDIFKFQTWQAHILDLFAVGFDRSKNPLRAGPSDIVRTVRFPSGDVTFQPVQIRGNWLRVRWNAPGEQKGKNVGYGWVKWKQNTQLLVEFFYFS